jgi:hypothetical protein
LMYTDEEIALLSILSFRFTADQRVQGLGGIQAFNSIV